MWCPSRIIVVCVWWCWDRRGWMVRRRVVQIIRVVFRIWRWMIGVVRTPWWCMPMAVPIPMWSSALNGGSPIIWWLPVVHFKGCLGFLIMSMIRGIYLRFWLIHGSSLPVQTALLGCAVFSITKNSLILVDLIGFCLRRDCGACVSARCPVSKWVTMSRAALSPKMNFISRCKTHGTQCYCIHGEMSRFFSLPQPGNCTTTLKS